MSETREGDTRALTRAEVVICGAGIAGIAAAWHLAVERGVRGVLLVDERAPLSLTSDKSTECYRNWWPGPDNAMVAMMNRSIDLLEALAGATGNAIHLNRRGYLYARADPGGIAQMESAARSIAALGAGELRVHGNFSGDFSGGISGGISGGSGASGALTYPPATPEPYRPAPPEGYRDQPDGADLILDPALIRQHFPYLSPHTRAVLHARRCGWFSGQQLGMILLEQAQAHGARFLRAKLEEVTTAGGQVKSVRLRREGASWQVDTGQLVIAAGPMLKPVAALLGVHLPVFSERHLKIAFPDTLGAVPRDAPLLIWEEPQRLAWSAGERAGLAENPETRRLLEPLPPGVHARPEGGPGSRNLLLLWSYQAEPAPEVFPLPEPPHYLEVVLRGMTAMVPAMGAYLERLPRGFIDGGYYTRTRENRPLCGPLPVRGAYVIGALSGFGLMSACALGELLAAHVTGAPLPDYAPAFSPQRYRDPAYRKRLEHWGDSGQL